MNEAVNLSSGQIKGLKEEGIFKFLGIPYAMPPIGDLRWSAPQKVKPWSDVLQCTKFAPSCPQPPRCDVGEESEDCLYLNIWTSAKSVDDKLPVMVWIHGGGFTIGSSSIVDSENGMFELDGRHLAQKGVVLVTINYRLGPFGFLAHPALSAESENNVSGNYGLLDQIEALKWVQENISSFGGDKDNVTIFGESAGAYSVSILMISPLAKNLFHRAIAQSGSVIGAKYIFLQGVEKLKEAEKQGEKFAERLGMKKETNLLDNMREKTTKEILEAADFSEVLFSFSDNGTFYIPVVDGFVIPDDSRKLYKEGKQYDVSLIIGTCANEASKFIARSPDFDVGDYKEWIKVIFEKAADEILERYPAKNKEEARSSTRRLWTILAMVEPARFIAKSMQDKKNKAYLYRFSRIPKTKKAQELGAYHGVDIPYAFGNFTLAQGYEKADLELSKRIMNYWVNFAKKGNPNNSHLLNWPFYDGKTDINIEFGDEIELKEGLYKEECDFIEKIRNKIDNQI